MRFLAAFALLAATGLSSPADAGRPIRFAATAPQGGTLVLPLRNADHLAHASMLDAASRDAVARALTSAAFDFSRASTLTLRGIGSWSKILVIGTGETPFDATLVQDIGGVASNETESDIGPVAVLTQTFPSAGPDAAAQLAIGTGLAAYVFDKYKFVDPAAIQPAGRNDPLTIVTADPARAEASFRGQGQGMVDAVSFVRDLINEPANVIYPETFVDRTHEAFRGVRNVDIQVLDVPAMERLGMGSILSVGKGSARPPRMLIVHYRGAGGQPVALAGKGITFDSGGISLKPGSGMWEMKGDMSGAAAVVGTALSLARAQAPVNVVAIAALAENMPGGSATRPGDIVKAMNGKTIEILNTDAEGRLVLADAVAYAERTFRPAAIIDVATLTGAKVTALGDEYAGLFSRSDSLAAQLLAAGEATGELVWRLPLHANYAKDMTSDVADIKNVVEGGGPGASLGAHFIGSFVTEATPWAHLDIAGNEMGTSWSPTVPSSGATGYGVRLLDGFVRNFRPVAAGNAQGSK
ncbi:MAG TPA: leucyl aminopeptidase [Allosphingosinicella sp.]|uniref:leucyl aminopeptidase n=1 Tax=Allosphingosinicella sp. TaxID=2823234 RepID=UPI002ED81F4B